MSNECAVFLLARGEETWINVTLVLEGLRAQGMWHADQALAQERSRSSHLCRCHSPPGVFVALAAPYSDVCSRGETAAPGGWGRAVRQYGFLVAFQGLQVNMPPPWGPPFPARTQFSLFPRLSSPPLESSSRSEKALTRLFRSIAHAQVVMGPWRGPTCQRRAAWGSQGWPLRGRGREGQQRKTRFFKEKMHTLVLQ